MPKIRGRASRTSCASLHTSSSGIRDGWDMNSCVEGWHGRVSNADCVDQRLTFTISQRSIMSIMELEPYQR